MKKIGIVTLIVSIVTIITGILSATTYTYSATDTSSKEMGVYEEFLRYMEDGYHTDGITGWEYNVESFALYDINNGFLPYFVS